MIESFPGREIKTDPVVLEKLAQAADLIQKKADQEKDPHKKEVARNQAAMLRFLSQD